MTRILRFFTPITAICVVLLSAFSLDVKASHIAAVDITVRYAGTGPSDLTYDVIVDLYFACEANNGGGSPGPAGVVYFFSTNAGDAAYTTAQPNRINTTWDQTVTVIDQLCEAYKPQNSCNTPTSIYPGFKHTRSIGTITLPSKQTDWTFWWTSCCRNGNIVNISTIANQLSPQGSLFVEAGIDNVYRYDNSTPVFTVSPLPYICVNQPATYLNGPLDPLGDSLVTVNMVPRQSQTQDYFYFTNYSIANPVGATAANPYAVDAATGTATFTPQYTGPHVVAYKVEKYDRATGKRVGFCNRDVQVSILQCSGAPPDISDPKNITFGEIDKDKFTSCSGVRFDFDLTSTTTLPNRNLYMEANLANLPGASLTVTGQGTTSVTGTFSWTPHYGNIGEHILIVTTKDSTCDAASPVVFKRHKVILLRVLPTIDAGPDKPICIEGGAPAEIFVKGADNYSLKWTDISGGDPIALSSKTAQTVYADPKGPATYIVSTSDVPAFCKNTDTISVFVDPTNGADVFPDNPIILCRPDYLQLDAKLVGKPSIEQITCGTSDTTTLLTKNEVAINGSMLGNYDTLGGLTPTFPNDMRSVRQQYFIKKADLFASGLSYGTLKGIAFEAIDPADPTYEYSNFRISIACTDEKAISKNGGFKSGLTQVFLATGPTAIADGWNHFPFEKAYSWDTSKNLLIEICYGLNATASLPGNSPVIRFVPTDYISTIKLAHASNNQCGIGASANIEQIYSRPQFRFDYYETDSIAVKYDWYPSVFLSDSTIQQPLAYIPRSTKYYVKTQGRSGCIVKDSADIYVPVHDYQILPVDSNICFGETAPMRAVKGGFTYKWYKINDKGQYEILSNTKESTCWDCGNPVLSPEKTTTYKVAVYDSVWCIDTLTHVITVMPLPDIRILNKDTVVKYGQSIQLLASGARMYNWTPVASLNNANVSYPVATPTEPTEFIAAGIGTNGCIARDTLKVAIDYRDNLFIPSGFSPNGDGKNDVFKVSNLTFQRIVEFRVFNRWGQEIFNANDNSGWDGAWKGEPQDMDTYTYQIRIGFPDGYIESYKGVVTIIR